MNSLVALSVLLSLVGSPDGRVSASVMLAKRFVASDAVVTLRAKAHSDHLVVDSVLPVFSAGGKERHIVAEGSLIADHSGLIVGDRTVICGVYFNKASELFLLLPGSCEGPIHDDKLPERLQQILVEHHRIDTYWQNLTTNDEAHAQKPFRHLPVPMPMLQQQSTPIAEEVSE